MGYSDSKKGETNMERLLGRSPPLGKKKPYESDFLLTLQMTFCKISLCWIHEVGSISCQILISAVGALENG